MISPELIQQLKQIPMTEYLAFRGSQPVSQQGHRFLYHSPFRAENTPSFWVNIQLNRYKDFGTSEKGDDIIQLVQRLDQCSFVAAIGELQRFQNQPTDSHFSFSGPTSKRSGTDTIRAVKLLNNAALIRYVESRRIPYPLARLYLREIYYTHKDKNCFAVGFANDQEGYELRTRIGEKEVKRCIGTKAITTISGDAAAAVNIFEGFFDFLSALAFFGIEKPRYTTIVLNSTTNLEKCLPTLCSFGRVNAYFDLDAGGRQALVKSQQLHAGTVDRSGPYHGWKDFNEYWVNVGNFQNLPQSEKTG